MDNKLWLKALNAAEAAELLFEAGSFDAACNRAYYGMFNAARALLMERGLDPDKSKRHATVISLFSLQFVRHGPFDPADGRALAETGRARNVADYGSETVGAEAAVDVMAALRRFMANAQREISNPSRDREEPNP
jgi:uncharacterized protein (UPF0332 family)